MGVALALEAAKMGADVTLVYGHGSADSGIVPGKVIRVNTGNDMLDAVSAELLSHKYDVAIMAAAVADFAPSKKSEKKVDSRAGKIAVELVKTKKIIDQIKRIKKDITLVAFKADHDVSKETLIEKALQKLKECDADIVVANDVGKVGRVAGPDRNEVFDVDRKTVVTQLELEDKNTIARRLLEIVARLDPGSKSPSRP
jgi:phosphopantothenoylcysteine decarboxylase/phosphopantothenate--cysteine ligase